MICAAKKWKKEKTGRANRKKDCSTIFFHIFHHLNSNDRTLESKKAALATRPNSRAMGLERCTSYSTISVWRLTKNHLIWDECYESCSLKPLKISRCFSQHIAAQKSNCQFSSSIEIHHHHHLSFILGQDIGHLPEPFSFPCPVPSCLVPPILHPTPSCFLSQKNYAK